MARCIAQLHPSHITGYMVCIELPGATVQQHHSSLCFVLFTTQAPAGLPSAIGVWLVSIDAIAGVPSKADVADLTMRIHMVITVFKSSKD